MPKHLLTAVVFLFAIAVTFACASAPTPAPSPQPANAPGGAAFLSPIETPAPATPATPGATTTPGPMQPPVVIELTLPTPVMANQSVTLTVNIRTEMELVDAFLGIGVETSETRHLQTYTRTLAILTPGELHKVVQPLLIPGDEGSYMIVASLTDQKRGATYNQALYFAVTPRGIVFNPTPPSPGVSPTIELLGRPTSLPTRTRQPTVTTQPNSNSTPTPVVTTPTLSTGYDSQRQIRDQHRVQSVAQPQQLVTIAGRLRIPGRSHLVDTTDPIPSKYTKVSVYNLNDLTTAPGDTIGGNPPDELLGETVTDANGYWYLYDVPLVDVDGTWPDVYVIFWTSNESVGVGDTLHTVRSESNQVYSFPLKHCSSCVWWDYPYPYDPPTSPVMDILLGLNTTAIRALWLFDDVNRAHDYTEQHVYQDPKQVHVYWTAGHDSGLGCNTSCFTSYSPSPNGFGVFIQNTFVEMPDVVVHEIAHAYRHNLTGLWASSCLSQHFVWIRSNRECAWEEGWADFLPTLVNNDPCYDDNTQVGPCDTPIMNLEMSHPRDGRDEGDAVEGRIAGALLDIHDYTNSPPGDGDEGWDNASGYGFWRTWTILNPASEPDTELTMPDFYNHWDGYSNFASESPIIGPLWQNTIKFPVFLPLQLNGYP